MPFLSTRRLATAGVVGAAAALFAAPQALAGTASVQDGIARYQAANGEDNGLLVSEAPHPTNPTLKVVKFSDLVPVTAGAGCSQDGTFASSCSVPVSTAFVRAGLEDLSDSIRPAASLLSMGFSVEGDSEGDRLVGSSQRDLLDGVSGNDTLFGNDGNDALEGATGNDTLEGGNGDDTIYGCPGEYNINGGAGRDYIDAGIHDDVVIGGPGGDTMYGYYGDDVINADDNAGGDFIHCGPGFDKAIFNDDDTVSTTCELQVHS